jgi:integrase
MTAPRPWLGISTRDWFINSDTPQEQVGHSHASTTAIYTGVSDEYRNRLLQRALTARHTDLEGPHG